MHKKYYGSYLAIRQIYQIPFCNSAYTISYAIKRVYISVYISTASKPLSVWSEKATLVWMLNCNASLWNRPFKIWLAYDLHLFLCRGTQYTLSLCLLSLSAYPFPPEIPPNYSEGPLWAVRSLSSPQDSGPGNLVAGTFSSAKIVPRGCFST